MKRDLGALAASPLDLLVVGGGIHGAAAVWDAARRGLRTALVEASDFGSGTSWNSLKTIHGGLRHLARLDLAAFRESVRERRTLLRLAPELVRPQAFLVAASTAAERARLGAGLLVNDLLGLDRNRGLPGSHAIPRGLILSAAEVAERVPLACAGGALWHDAQVSSSERLLLGVLHAAVDAGARLANHAKVARLVVEAGRLCGVLVRDELTQSVLEIRARAVLSTAGPGLDPVLSAAGLRPLATPALCAINLVLARPLAPPGCAIGVRSRGRYLFLVPWGDRAMIGTEYGPQGGDPGALAAAFLAECAQAFPWVGLASGDVSLVHRGMVPGEGGVDGLRRRAVFVDHAADGATGLFSVQGVKYTTARAVAEHAVDRVARHLGSPARGTTASAPPLAKARRLDGTLEERTRIAVRDEMAHTLADAVLRRLDLGTGGAPAATDLDRVAAAMGRELGWDAARLDRERAELARTWALRPRLPS